MTLSTTDPAPANIFVNLLDIIASPGTALRRISLHHRRSWLLPALLSLIGAILYLWITIDEQVAIAKRAAEMQISEMQISGMQPQQIEATQAAMDQFMQPTFILTTGIVTIVLGLVFAWLLSSLILYLGAAVMGANPKFQQLWSPVVWTWIPLAFRSFFYAIWAVVTGKAVLYPGLAYFVATGDLAADQQSPQFLAAAQIDIFGLWHVALVFVLLRAVTRLGGGGAFILTLIYALINVGIRVLPGFLGGLVG